MATFDPIEDQLKKAEDLRIKGDTAGAVEAFEIAKEICVRARQINGVIFCLERLVALNPDDVRYDSELIGFYEHNKQYEKAYHIFKKVWDEKTGLLKDESTASAIDFARAGEYAYHARFADVAIANIEKSLAIESNNPQIWCFLGRAHSSSGNKDAAWDAFQKALDINPYFIPAYYYLSRIRGFEIGNPAFENLEGLKTNENMAPRIKADLGFALGRMWENVEEFDKAFENFNYGNAASREQSVALGYTFDRAGHAESFKLISSLYAPKNRKKLKYKGSDTKKPIFIIGMQRSGTTLLEQIMAAHSEISSAGELTYLAINQRDLMTQTNKVQGAEPEAALLKALDEQAESYAEVFLDVLNKKGEGTAMVIDKLPQNFIQVGLINVLFPNAKIIHIRRDPLDVGVSIYSSQFSSDLSFAQDLGDIGYYISQYRTLMAEWKKVVDIPIHEIEYEALVDDPETVAKGVIEFCGLEWQPECLEYYKNPGKVFTSSVMQVRNPINKSAIGKWKNFEKYLDPLKQALKN